MHGSYRQGEGTNGGRLRVFSSDQAPWRVLLQALDRPSNSGKWNLGQYCTVQRGVLDKSKISRWGSFFNHFKTLVQKDPNGETEARTPSATAPNLPWVTEIEIHRSSGGPHKLNQTFKRVPWAAADRIFRSFSDPVLLFWYQDFTGAGGQIQVFMVKIRVCDFQIRAS
jgi:hypothetical protein